MKARKRRKRSRPERLKRKSARARALQPIVLGGVLFGSAFAQGDSHLIPVAGDTDGDYLSDVEERAVPCVKGGWGGIITFHDPLNPDEWSTGIPDGVDLCRDLTRRIAELPTFLPGDDLPTTLIFKIQRDATGNIGCPVCGEILNMGCYSIVNPILQTELDISILALHFMEHDGFTYGDPNEPGPLGRVNIGRLLSVLDPHLVPIDGDADLDLLTDAEEAALGAPPDRRDADRNAILDGVDLAQALARRIGDLETFPYDATDLPTDRIYKLLALNRGDTGCEICVQAVNMGNMRIVNPLLPASIRLPILTIHYLEHGSFRTGADRVDVQGLVTTLDYKFPGPAKARKSWVLYE